METARPLASGSVRRKRLWREIKNSAGWYPFILVNIIVFVVFTALPYILMVQYSFTQFDMLSPAKFIGLQNYARLLTDNTFHIAVKNTIAYTLMDVPFNIVLSLLVAILVNQITRGVTFFRTSLFLPNITSITVLALIFFRFLSPRPDAPLNYIIGLFGIPPQKWFVSETLALPSVVGVSVWQSFGYFMILWLAGLKSIPMELYDAAKVDGASGWRMQWYMTLPLLRPTAAFIIMIATIGALQVFSSIYLLTGGGPVHATTTVAFYLYQRAFTFAELGYACAISIVLFAAIMTVTTIQGKYLRFGESHY
jgi:multiple sugar transport system permease protein